MSSPKFRHLSSQARFGYSEHPLNSSFGLPFDYNGTLGILITPGQKGILIFWFEKSLLVSRNSGEPGPGSGCPASSSLSYLPQTGTRPFWMAVLAVSYPPPPPRRFLPPGVLRATWAGSESHPPVT